MDQQMDALGMLDLMVSPVFCVKNQTIIKCNAAAESLLLREGMQVLPLLATGRKEYEEFISGCLYLTLDLSGVQVGASVTRVEDYHVFVLDEQSDQAELQAMALAARELRIPLTGIMTTADHLFPLSAVQEDPVMREQVARMNRGLYQMLRIISNMSDACLYSASPESQLETAEISGFMEELFVKAQDLVSHAGIALHFKNLPQPLYMLADSEKLERAVLNILSNAIKFTPPGGTIEARLNRRGTQLYLTVQDSGEGMPDSIRSSVHRRYQRPPGLEDRRHGIGLGLVLIRSAAAIHGGTVLIDHPEDRGTRITMTLAIRQNNSGTVRSHQLRIDYAGERDHGLIELSDILPAELYDALNIN